MAAGVERLWLILMMASITFTPLNISPEENHRKGHIIGDGRKAEYKNLTIFFFEAVNFSLSFTHTSQCKSAVPSAGIAIRIVCCYKYLSVGGPMTHVSLMLQRPFRATLI
jgi:hypothetical protein